VPAKHRPPPRPEGRLPPAGGGPPRQNRSSRPAGGPAAAPRGRLEIQVKWP